MTPPESSYETTPYVLYNLGGILMNFIFSAIFWILFAVFINYTIVAVYLLFFAVIGIITAINNDIPVRSDLLANDGYNTMMLVKNDKAVRAFRIQLLVNSKMAHDVSIKDMPDEWFVTPDDADLKSCHVSALALLVCERLNAERRFDEAYALIRRLLSIETGLLGIYRTLLINEMIYYELIGENRSEAINSLTTPSFKKKIKTPGNNLSVKRTNYAYARIFEKNSSKAGMCKKFIEKVQKRYPYPQDLANERELIAIADKKASEM